MGRKPRVDRSPEEKWQIVQEGMKSGNVSEVGDTESLRRSTSIGKAKQNTFPFKGPLKTLPQCHCRATVLRRLAVLKKGQATIPKAIREHLRLKPRDRVKFFMHPDGSVVLLPKLPAAALRGMIKSRGRRPVTIGEMTDAAAAFATKND